MSQEDVVSPLTPQDGCYVSVLCGLLGDIQAFPSELPVWLGVHSLGWGGVCLIRSRSAREGLGW